MIINLSEIPEEGQQFICNTKTADLNEALRDLIGKAEHQAQFFIKPLQPGTYELTGKIETKLPEDCSRCGLDFDMNVNEKFQEILIPAQKLDRTDKLRKANHVSDMHESGPAVYEYKGNQFDAGEYFHQLIGLAEPLTPAPACDAQGNCSLCHKYVKGEPFKYEEPGFEEPANPFEALKNIKLN